MKKFLMMTALSLSIAVCLTAHAQDDKAPKESKMGQCHKDAKAKNLKGDERKTFMKECLSAKAPASDTAKSSGSQQNKMKRCNEEASGLKGDERKQKMSACLKA
jgi:hypothetical protein